MPFNIMLHTVRKHYAIQYHAAYSMQALCRSISCCMQYAIIMPFNIMLHTVRTHYAVPYHVAYSTQALCRSISCCIYGTQALRCSISCCIYSTQALCRSISCCIQYASIGFSMILKSIMLAYCMQHDTEWHNACLLYAALC